MRPGDHEEEVSTAVAVTAAGESFFNGTDGDVRQGKDVLDHPVQVTVEEVRISTYSSILGKHAGFRNVQLTSILLLLGLWHYYQVDNIF